MLHKTQGIVLNHLKYGDTSLISTIYTSTHGRKTFLIQGVYKRKSRFHASFFQPLTLLDLEIYVQPRRELQRIREISIDHPFQHIPFDTTKSAIALFLSEILYKTLKEEEPNPSLFDYLYHALQFFDVNTIGSSNFHLVFLINLSRFLGFYPINNFSETNCLFDSLNGRFFPYLTTQQSESERKTSFWMHQLLNTTFENLDSLSMNHQIRNDLLRLLIEFYSLHLGGLGAIKSHSVLQNVFED
jgi:DNA repair protein RecO (recombination protein O)